MVAELEVGISEVPANEAWLQTLRDFSYSCKEVLKTLTLVLMWESIG